VSNRLNCVSGVDPVFPNSNAHARFNPAAFTNTVVPQFGNCARNNLIGPKQVNFDFSAIKDFRLAERQTLQFAAESVLAQHTSERMWLAPGAGQATKPPVLFASKVYSGQSAAHRAEFWSRPTR
jgi:hypothetical protein